MTPRQFILFIEVIGEATADPGPFVLDEGGFAILDENGEKIYLEEKP